MACNVLTFQIGVRKSTLILCLVATSGCLDPDDPLPVVERDREAFRCDVYPVLLRDCGFPACHGTEDRFFQVFGPGRTRLDGVGIFGDATDREIDVSLERTRSMLDTAPPFEQSLLLRKPLDPTNGGAGHFGVDPLGRDVYASEEDPGYQALARWARGEVGAGCP